ncbi:hypothetical protein GUJ93_ZPchr0003g18387 [Zizania palustris]|uniref:Uncharacterized protein n=1 Tax=Zizania palustris TaxID=103762 RepID=A0A8J5S8F3_ZIZPA|nr:hypothetical protein GUJ93_ZPchr0003g18387 [Zizania palustris]
MPHRCASDLTTASHRHTSDLRDAASAHSPVVMSSRALRQDSGHRLEGLVTGHRFLHSSRLQDHHLQLPVLFILQSNRLSVL